jgi:hypothetical protein
LNAVLKAAELKVEFVRTFSGQTVDDPLSTAFGFDHAMLAEIGEVLGDGDLIEAEDGLKMADAELPVRQQVENAKTGLVAKTFVYLNQFQFHASGRIYR